MNHQKIFDRDFAYTAILYAASVLILSFYCLNACSFGKMPKPSLFTLLIIFCFCVTLILRTVGLYFLRKKEPRVQIQDQQFQIKNPWNYLFVDFASWIFSGALLIIFSISLYNATFTTSIEILIGSISMGVFYSRFLSLRVENEMIVALGKAGHFMNFPSRRYYSLSTKFFLFVMIGLTIISTVSILLFYKDFSLLKAPGADISRIGFTQSLYEFLFALLILYSGACAVAYQYRKNFNTAMKYQLAAFSAVEKENYNVMVPVVTEDEFSLIAIGTNRMIAGLQEKDKIKKAFGKYMSPSVANAILASERGTSLEGRLVNPVVMFIDIRDYTIFAESRAPQEVVGMLNAFFSLVVRCVHEHHGVVDKFIGDAAMAIFGLDETENSCEAAIKTALDIIHLMPSLNENLQARGLPPISIGVGIHNGPAIAGNIGSEERLEYTVIGDAVNIASRLQSLNKTLNTTLIVSEPIYQAAPPELQSLFTFKGSQPLKGKSYALPVYSL